ncbi:acetate--CoA ligase family protein [Nitriliruptor alkaliphilus]|uniref:acetate--CoA ligase family protein n=1 Tax=Nitriliruptor alkaliphilus TaxID=427918 RepID=UPI000695F6E2|nr:acetate--CoA ligase family protein [Nitriliruptor alkaliphilus]
MIVLSEWEAKRRLGEGLPVPAERLTTSVDEAIAFATEHAPAHVVAKASGVAHKTEGGLVRLGLDVDGVAACWSELAAAGDGQVLVAEQVRGEYELLVGGLRDDVFGPVVSVGVGGVTAELDPDVAFCLAPPLPGELDAALGQLRAAPLLDGFRGGPPLDRGAFAELVAAVARVLEDPAVTEIDCNPVVVRGGLPVVLDALVVLGDPDHATPVTEDRP